jgi:hypothetical protein
VDASRQISADGADQKVPAANFANNTNQKLNMIRVVRLDSQLVFLWLLMAA